MTGAAGASSRGSGGNVRLEYPCRLVSEANTHEHWAAKARRAKAHRRQAWAMLTAQGDPPAAERVTVTITRIAPRRLDGDNLQRAAKATRDGVADWLRRDDGDDSITWRYEQERGGTREYAVRIEVMT